MQKRAATYLRVSRSDQSSAMQADETSSLIARRGWSAYRQFADEGISGAHDRRPAFREMMEQARRRRFDVLVVWRADRLFRSLHELVGTLRELAALGIDFVSVTEPFDTSTPTGTLLVQLCGAFAEFERNVLIERTRAGMAAARRRGRHVGRPRKGLDVDQVLALRAQGRSIRAIAAELECGAGSVARALAAAPRVPEGSAGAPSQVSDFAAAETAG